MNENGRPFDVFVSHSTDDRAVANAITHSLEAEGLRCWIAPRDITPGRDWDESIVDAIDECRVMVLVLSASSNASGQVIKEVQNAVDGGSAVLPFRIAEVPLAKALRFRIGSAHWLDAVDPPMEDRLTELCGAVRRLLAGDGTRPDPPPRPSARVPERAREVSVPAPRSAPAPVLMALGGGAGVGLVLLAGFLLLGPGRTASEPQAVDMDAASVVQTIAPVGSAAPEAAPSSTPQPSPSLSHLENLVSSRVLAPSDLQGLSSWELDVLRNGIYARHGRGFTRDELQRYFEGQAWYVYRYEPDAFPDALLSPVERANAEYIASYQRRVYGSR